jgi:hypothetical protein
MSGGDESSALRSAIPREDVIFTDLDGSEGVLVDLNSKKFYQLNESAILIWRGLEKRMSIDMIAEEMTTVYEVSFDQARSSVEGLLASLKAQKLVSSV